MITHNNLSSQLEQQGFSCQTLETTTGGWALVTPELGAKILGAGVDKENTFWNPDQIEKGQWCVGGQRTWLAPELGPRGFFGTTEQNWSVNPALDPGSFTVESESDQACTCSCASNLRVQEGTLHHLSITRTIRVAPVQTDLMPPEKTLRISFTHRLINRGQQVLKREIGLWSIIQVPSQKMGTLLIPWKNELQANEPSTKAKDLPYRLYFGSVPKGWAKIHPDLIYIKAWAGHKYKIGLPPENTTGRLGFITRSRLNESWILIVKQFSVDPLGTYVDKPPAEPDRNGDALQCYNSHDASNLPFSEMECHAPALQLRPKESQSVNIDIMIFKSGLKDIATLCTVYLSESFDIR